MSVHVLSWAWSVEVGDPSAKLVLLKLADQANDLGECWPAVPTIARDCEMSDRSVQRKLADLTERGVIVREERKGTNGRRTSDLFRLVRGDRLSPGGCQIVTGPVTTVSPLEPLKEPSSFLTERARSPLDEMFGALVEAVYPAGAKLTDAEKRKVAIAARNILSAGATPEMVPLVKRAYLGHTAYGKCALTAHALSSRWAELAPLATSLACPACGIKGGRHADGCERIAA